MYSSHSVVWMCLTFPHRQSTEISSGQINAALMCSWSFKHVKTIKDAAIKSETVSELLYWQYLNVGWKWRSWTDWTGSEQIPTVALRGRALTVSLPPDSGGIVPLCVQWDWTCSCMLLIDCPLKLFLFFFFFPPLSLMWQPWNVVLCCGGSEHPSTVHKNISPLSTLRSPTPPAAPHSRPTAPRNTHTFHKTCHTSAAQSGVMLDSVNSPDGELNKSYNAT